VSWRDVAAARNAGITSVLVRTGEARHGQPIDANFAVEDFTAAVDLILDERCVAEALSGETIQA
jgi:ribonucleotide monophosphatase NagD (HAD superfamily)